MSDGSKQREDMFKAIRNKFLEGVGQRAAPIVDKPWDEVMPEIEAISSALEKANAYRIKDPQSEFSLKMSSMILAVYRTLLPLFENRQDLLDILKAVLKAALFAGDMEEYLFSRFGISMDAPEQAWDQVCKRFKKGGEEQFGKVWVYEQGIMDHKRCFVNIRKCGFADFFLDNGAGEVLYLLCVLDYVWGDALEKYGIRLERPTILAEGSDACRFQLFKMSPRS